MMIALYASLFLAPFIQEDAAVFGGAAAASASGMIGADPASLFVTVVAGLIASDVWKYWAGRWAQTHGKVRAWAEKPGVVAAKEKVLTRLGATLFAARFIPGTRIAAYLAAGLFGAPFLPFLGYLVASAILYVGLAFGLVAVVGAAAGEQAVHALAIAVGAAALLFVGFALWRRRRVKLS
ncbi:MAG: hypothetical protein GC189_11205 [Alphaproteobacteria bacterium]|nr:hypothetical protein [Alphaproteobacteria bacterium]